MTILCHFSSHTNISPCVGVLKVHSKHKHLLFSVMN